MLLELFRYIIDNPTESTELLNKLRSSEERKSKLVRGAYILVTSPTSGSACTSLPRVSATSPASPIHPTW